MLFMAYNYLRMLMYATPSKKCKNVILSKIETKNFHWKTSKNFEAQKISKNKTFYTNFSKISALSGCFLHPDNPDIRIIRISGCFWLAGCGSGYKKHPDIRTSGYPMDITNIYTDSAEIYAQCYTNDLLHYVKIL